MPRFIINNVLNNQENRFDRRKIYEYTGSNNKPSELSNNLVKNNWHTEITPILGNLTKKNKS